MYPKRLRILIMYLCLYLMAGTVYLPRALAKELVPPSVPQMIALDRQIPYIDQEKFKAEFLNLLYRFDSLDEAFTFLNEIAKERFSQYLHGTAPQRITIFISHEPISNLKPSQIVSFDNGQRSQLRSSSELPLFTS